MKRKPNSTFRHLVAASAAFAAFFAAGRSLEAAALGTLLADYNTGASRMVVDPTRPRLYAVIPSTHSVKVIDTNSLAVLATLPVGNTPVGLAVSPDGSRLYVANSDTTTGAINVIDLATLTALPSINTVKPPWDIQVGLSNRLYVTASVQDSIGYPAGSMMIDGNTGSFLGYFNTVASVRNWRANIQMSPDQRTLYIGDVGISGASLESYDVSTATATRIAFNSGGAGSNGKQLVLSHNGQFICDVTGGGVFGAGYAIRMLSTSDLRSSLGVFQVGPYPNGVGFSPDDAYAYANNTSNTVQVFNTSDGSLAGQFTMGISAINSLSLVTMAVDRSGSHLFVGTVGASRYNPSAFQVYDTGRSVVPEPTSAALLLGGGALLALRRRRA